MGRVDPVTKEIRPKGDNGKRNRMKQTDEINELKEQFASSQQSLNQAQQAIQVLQSRLDKSIVFFDDLKGIMSKYEKDIQSETNPLESPNSGAEP